MTLANEISLWLFILFLGLVTGAGLFEIRIILPVWFKRGATGLYRADSGAMEQFDTGRRFWAFVTTLPLTILTITNLVMALKDGGPAKEPWLLSTWIILAERVLTFAFFIPTIIKLQRNNYGTPERVDRMIRIWQMLNYLRMLLTVIAWFFAVKALAIAI